MMEDIVKRIVFNAKDNASSSLNHISKSAQNLQNTFLNLGNIFTGIIAGQGLGKIIKPAMEMESAMADVRKVVDFDTPEQFNEMSKQLTDLSTKIPIAATELAKMAAAGGQLGIARDKLVGFTELAGKMGVAFGISADDAGNNLAKLSNVLNVPIDKMEEVGDIFNHLSNNMVSTAKDITEVMLKIGSVGSVLGLTKNQAAALSSTMLSLGAPADKAGTSIKIMLARIAGAKAGSTKAKLAFKSLGVDIWHLNKLIDSGKGQEAIFEVLNKINSVGSATDKVANVTHAFGQEAFADIIKLAKGMKTYKQALDLVSNKSKYTNSMTKEFDSRSGTLENMLSLLKNKITAIGKIFGDTLLPDIKKVVEWLDKVTDKFYKWAQKNTDLVKKIARSITAFLVVGPIYRLAKGLSFLFLSPFFKSLKWGYRLLKLVKTFKFLNFAKIFSFGCKGGLLKFLTAFKSGKGILKPLLGLLKTGLTSILGLLFSPTGLIITGLTGICYTIWDIIDKGFENSWLGKLWNNLTGKSKNKTQNTENKKWVVDKQVEGMTILKIIDMNEKKNVASLDDIVPRPAGTATNIMAQGIKNTASFNGKIKIENTTNNKITSSFDTSGMGLDLIFGQREFIV